MKRACLFHFAATLLAAAAAVTTAHAQDSHHWNLRYGTEAEMLTGSVIGSRLGLSSTFYNPGALSLVPDPKLFTTALAAEYTRITVTNVPKRADGFQWSSTSSSPSLVAGLFYHNKEKGRLWGYSYLVRQKFDFELDDRVIDTRDALTAVPGDEYFSAEFITKSSAEEIWGGVTLSQRQSKKSGLGMTIYGAYRTQKTRLQTFAQTVSDSGQGASTIIVDDYRFSTFRLLAKLGWAFEVARIQGGISLTTPSLHLGGSGSSYLNASLIGVDPDGDGDPDSELASNFQEDLPATYKSSWAVGVGAARSWGNTTVHLSAEWFNAVKKYVVLKGEPFVGQTTGDTILVVATQELRSVINVAVGLDHKIKESLKVYGGFSTDFSAAADDPGRTNISRSTWDIYHVSAGAEFLFKRIEFTLGTTVSWGSELIRTLIDLDNAADPNKLIGYGGEAEAQCLRLKLILGFTLPV